MRKIAATAAALLSSVALASPASASAANDTVLLTVGSATSPYGNRVDAVCDGGPGVAADLNHVTYAVRGVAQASSPRGSLSVGTTIACWIIDTRSGAVWGPEVTGFSPTSTAAAAGTIRARSTGYLKMCSEAYALFNDNTPPAHYLTPGC